MKGVGRRGGLETAVKGQGGASDCRARGPDGRPETQRATLPGGHPASPSSCQALPGLRRALLVVAPHVPEATLRKWSSAPAGWKGWWCTGGGGGRAGEGGGRGKGGREGRGGRGGGRGGFCSSRKLGKLGSGVGKLGLFCTEVAAEMNSSLRGILKINEDITAML